MLTSQYPFCKKNGVCIDSGYGFSSLGVQLSRVRYSTSSCIISDSHNRMYIEDKQSVDTQPAELVHLQHSDLFRLQYYSGYVLLSVYF